MVTIQVNVTSHFNDTIVDKKKEFNRLIINLVNQYLKQNTNNYIIKEKQHKQ